MEASQIFIFFLSLRLGILKIRVADPHLFHPDPDPDLRLNTNPDPDPIRIQSGSRALMTKNWKKITDEKNLIFFLSKTKIYLSLGLHKVSPSYRRSLQLSKEAIQHFKTWTLKKFPTFGGHFCPPGSGSGFPDWIRIQSGSGSATLLKIKTMRRIDVKYWFKFIGLLKNIHLVTQFL